MPCQLLAGKDQKTPRTANVSLELPAQSLACQQGPLHQQECQVLSGADFEADIEDCDAPDDHYAAILPLRCLALKKDPTKWEVFSSFLSHCEARRDSGGQLWRYHQEHSVQMLRDTLELKEQVSVEEIHRSGIVCIIVIVLQKRFIVIVIF